MTDLEKLAAEMARTVLYGEDSAKKLEAHFRAALETAYKQGRIKGLEEAAGIAHEQEHKNYLAERGYTADCEQAIRARIQELKHNKKDHP